MLPKNLHKKNSESPFQILLFLKEDFVLLCGNQVYTCCGFLRFELKHYAVFITTFYLL